jgi:MFS family permease
MHVRVPYVAGRRGLPGTGPLQHDCERNGAQPATVEEKGLAHYHAGVDAPASDATRPYAWIVFALTFGLLISDYMSRQVLNAVFPLLKADWALSDARLGLLSGIVALMVGLLTFPLSLLADRWGRVRSLTLMATLWSLATLACGLAKNFEQMFLARLFVGIGEAAYGSVGVAVVLSVFPPRLRATMTGAFMAGGMFGSVLGMAAGGVLAAHFGWRWSFAGMAFFGLALAAVYPMIVRESRIAPATKSHEGAAPASSAQTPQAAFRSPLATVFATPSVISAYVGSGLQLFIGASLMAWMPSYLNRYYGMGADRAGVVAAAFVLCCGAGMIVCGVISDRFGKNSPPRKLSLAIALCLTCFVLLSAGFHQPAGALQLATIALGMFVAAGTAGPAGAMVANLTHYAIHGTAFATLTLANNLLGLAPGPFVTGALADRLGLQGALQVIPCISLAAALAFLIGKRYYARDLQRVRDFTLGAGVTSAH